jgi:arylsulfatase
MMGSRSLYHNGWKATTNFVQPMFGDRKRIVGSHDFDDDHWGLFDLEADFSEAHDLSARHPEKVRELQELWWHEAGRNQVLPLNGEGVFLPATHPGPYPAAAAAVFHPGAGPISPSQLPVIVNGFRVTASVELADGDPANGVLCAIGDVNEGWSFYLLDGRPVLCMSTFGHLVRVAGDDPIGAGPHKLEMAYTPASPAGSLRISVDGSTVATGSLALPPFFAGLSTGGVGLLVGRDRGLPFCDDYTPPFPFSGTLRRVTMRSSEPTAAPEPETDLQTVLRSD